MANLTPYLTEKYTKMITEITVDLGKTADDLANMQNIIRALKNPDMMVDGAPLTLERLQVMETGDIRVMPPPPAPGPDTCTQEKNGKKPEKELVNAG
jgi:hypothetical protein